MWGWGYGVGVEKVLMTVVWIGVIAFVAGFVAGFIAKTLLIVGT